MPQSRDQEVSDTSQVARQRRRFTESFKRDAVALVTHQQYSFQAAARAVGVSDNSLRIWHKQYAPQPEACGQDATVEQVQAENIRLREQLKRAEMERDILKKATAYFANQNP